MKLINTLAMQGLAKLVGLFDGELLKAFFIAIVTKRFNQFFWDVSAAFLAKAQYFLNIMNREYAWAHRSVI